MQRNQYLRNLSSEHHQALALARDIKNACSTGEQQDALIKRVEAIFVAELLPHFDIEEQTILPALKRVGETSLVTKTLQDHAHLKKLVSSLAEPGNLVAFSSALKEHVRFEERTLFEVCQSVLTDDELAAIDSLHHQRDR
jgi:hemerythrin-like domain-containing protein